MITRRKPLRRVSKKRATQLREYSTRRARYLAEHRVCEVWCRENGWQRRDALAYENSGWGDIGMKGAHPDFLIHNVGAPAATEIHHVNKRRGTMLNDETHWLAVCRKNHERIENDKAWARREGFLLNF